jgi:uncharacterized membrane protein YphA (DoxX/SURF4 family)
LGDEPTAARRVAGGKSVELAATGFRFFLSALFLFAGLAKLNRRAEFETAVRNYSLLPGRLVRPVARTLPAAEIAAGALLAVGLATAVVAGALAMLLVVFAVAVAVNLLRGRSIDCGCYGVVAERRIGWVTVARDIALFAVAVVVAVEHPAAMSVDALADGGQGVSSSDAVALLVIATLGLFGLGMIEQAWRLRRGAAAITPPEATLR